MNEREFYKRVAGVFQPQKLKSKSALVVGLGSGGCRVAAELGRLGLRLVLVERPGERLLEHNIVRHVLGCRSLGKSKLGEMASYIKNLNPAARVTARALDVVEQHSQFVRLLEQTRPDLIAVCTDNEPSKHRINEAALRLGIPQVGAGVYDGGVGGEVYLVRPGQACYGCIAAQIQPRRPAPPGRADPDYSRLDLAEARATCALNLDIEQIALLHARLALNLLLGGEPDLIGIPARVNLCVFANRIVPGIFDRPLHGEFFCVPQDPECLLCGRRRENLEAEAEQILASLEP